MGSKSPLGAAYTKQKLQKSDTSATVQSASDIMDSAVSAQIPPLNDSQQQVDVYRLSALWLNHSVVKSRWLCYFQESRSTCQKFYFLESRSSVKIFYFLESRK